MYLLSAVVGLVVYVLPYVWLGEGAYLTVHDNLDSDLLYLHLLKISRTAFAFDLNTVVPNVMNGIPRSAFRSGLNLEVLSFYLLPTYWAQVVNFALIHGIGFAGMYALIHRYVLPQPEWAFTRVAVAFLFALVPGYTVHGASVSGQPLLLWAFLNLLTNRSRWSDWLIISLFPFYSFFVWAGLFIGLALGILGLGHMTRSRRVHWPYVGGLTLLMGLYLLSEWQMIYSFLARTYVSHRTEYDLVRLLPMTVTDSLRKAGYLFVQTQYHSGAFGTVGILAVACIAAWRAYRRRDYRAVYVLAGFVGLAGLICLVNGFYRFPAVWLGPGNLLQAFQFDRFYFLLPLLWFVLFAITLRQFAPNGRLNRLFLLGQLVVMVVANQEFRINVGKLAGLTNDEEYPAYRAFYATRQFAQIRDYIRRPQASYRVVSVGMHPAVAQYNGFYTLDSYQNNYRLSYKHQFREVIAPELAKAPAIRTYYDAYGCRCYTYCAELGMGGSMQGKRQTKAVRQLTLNPAALRALGGEYVISAVPIQTTADNQLQLVTIFGDSESYWRVWLYEVKGV